MEGKYGRLFTEEDVRRLIQRAQNRLTEPGVRDTTLAELVDLLGEEGEPVTFPLDEPLFLLRGQDRLAADAVGRYVRQCIFYLERVDPPVSAEHVENASEAYQAMMRWQIANPDRVKVPD